MQDLFSHEQSILERALRHLNEIKNGSPCDENEFALIVKEYCQALRLLRMLTRISDRTTGGLNTTMLDLQDKLLFDVLTGIYNRRFLDEHLGNILKTLSRSGESLISILMVDVDFFKKYNDTHGHKMGDACLKAVAGALKESLTRTDDFVARYGGEEFVLVLPNTNENGAKFLARRALENVMALNIPHEASEAANIVTISIGVTTGKIRFSHKGEDYINIADKALYLSKQQGRNRYTFMPFKEDPVC